MQTCDLALPADLPPEYPVAVGPLDNVACCRDLSATKREPVTEAEFRRGQVLDGRFFITEVLCCAGMATIYKAQDLENRRRPVVVKIPLAHYESDAACHQRFRREESVGLSLDHPLLLKFIPTEADRSRLYLVTEFVAGCTLEDILQKHGPLAEADALRITSVLGEAVQAMHDQGVVHNDLKPSNVMIGPDGTLRLMDFGLATRLADRRGLFGSFVPVFGTPQYMAPEQVRNRRTDVRTDVYCLGAMLFEMLTGRVPFHSDDAWENVRHRLSGDPAAPRRLNPVVSEAAEEIVLHELQRKPEDRYPTVAAFRSELDMPEAVRVTGYARRLKTPRWRLTLEQTQLLYGVVFGVGGISFLIGAFIFLSHNLGKR